MTDAIKALLAKEPTWFFNTAAIFLLAILVVFLYWAYRGAKNYAEAVNKENKLTRLLEERNSLQQEKLLHKAITEQMSVVLENSTNFIKALNNYDVNNTSNQIQTIIESLATDIKTVVGERHRCGFWVNTDDNNQFLTLVNGSASFPNDYINNRTLDVNRSIAGRSYRKKETLLINDVINDADWVFSDSPSSYSSLICVPVGPWGVITIDGKQEMTHNTVLIGRLYASIIEGLMNNFLIDLRSSEQQQLEAAATLTDENEGGIEDEYEDE
jgi:putative methionine-R-sulfoxide reductase with GAF domain